MPINIQRSPLGEHTIRVVPTAGVRLVGEGPQGSPGPGTWVQPTQPPDPPAAPWAPPPLWLDTDAEWSDGGGMTVAEGDTRYQQLAHVGNLLTPNQAGTSDASGWTTAGNCTLAVVGGAIVVTATSTTTYSARTASPYVQGIKGGQMYTASAMLAPVGRSGGVRLRFFDVNGSSLAFIVGTIVQAGGNGVSQVTAVAPPTATQAAVYIDGVTATGNVGDTLTITRAGLWEGAGGDWAMPGTPIQGLGHRVNPSSGLLEAWNGSAWVQVQDQWETAATWAALPASGNWPGRRIAVQDGLKAAGAVGLVAVWDGAKWQVDPVSDTGLLTVQNNKDPNWASSTIQVRRVGATVAWYWTCSTYTGPGVPGDGSTKIMTSIEAAYRPPNPGAANPAQGSAFGRINGPNLPQIGVASSTLGLLVMTPGGPASWGPGSSTTQGSVHYTTTAAWPTTAP